MKLKYDKEADAAYIYLDRDRIKVAETKELSDSVFIDYDAQGKPLGIEIIGVKDRIPSKALKYFQTQEV